MAGIVESFSGGTVELAANEWGHRGADRGTLEGGLRRIPSADEYWYDYWVKLEQGWIEGLGGKWPGLAGGRATSGGADRTPNGWSSRIMWGTMHGGLREYRYHQRRRGKYGDNFPWDGFRTLDPGRWYRITQHLKINTPDKDDGSVQFFVNGILVWEDKQVEWRGKVRENVARIDRVRNDVFRGGGTRDWAVDKDTRVTFSDFYVLDCPPDMRKGGPEDEPIPDTGQRRRTKVATVVVEAGQEVKVDGRTIEIWTA